MSLRLNGETIAIEDYVRFHDGRFQKTMALVRQYGGGKVVEVGGHPWAMTARLLAEESVTISATVSAEEVCAWSDELPVVTRDYEMQLADGRSFTFPNISANIERTLIPLREQADMVLACEVIEHLTRAPHTMLLNINSWLKTDGLVIITTPNGSQLENPFRRKPKMPAFRPSVYSRHNYVFTMSGLLDLVECCGFEVVHSAYWSPYARNGASNLYRSFYGLGPQYLKDKFAQTICIVARKTESVTAAARLPVVYAPQDGWERVHYTADTTPEVHH